jgi:hypothetical protein
MKFFYFILLLIITPNIKVCSATLISNKNVENLFSPELNEIESLVQLINSNNLAENAKAKFCINDMLGKEVQSFYLDGNVKRMTTKLNNFSKGVYTYYFIENGMLLYIGKLVIK